MNADFHLHSAFSEDSDAPMEQMIREAIARRMDAICFTEHTDLGMAQCVCCDCEAYRSAFNALRERYTDRIKLFFGMEFGVQRHTAEDYRRLFGRYDFDFIIMSCHQVDNQEICRYDYQRGKSVQAYMTGYYEEILACVQRYRDYSVLGHLDMICRYDREGHLPFHSVRDLVAEILKTAISDGKGIEVNTSSFRYHMDDLTPSRDILRLYRDLGGEVLTLGSDAHEPAYVGAHFGEVREALKDLGFRGFCTFERMKPAWHAL